MNVVTVHEDADFSQAYEAIMNNRLTHLCLINRHDQLVGLLSQKYVFKAQSPRKVIDKSMEPSRNILIDGDSFYLKETLDSFIVRNVMQKNPLTMTKDTLMLEAVREMSNRHIGCIPIVTEDKKVCGLLTDQDIVRFLAQMRDSFSQILLNQIMQKPVISINEEESFSGAYELITKKHLTHLCIVDKMNHIKGILSHKYAYRMQSPRKILNNQVNVPKNIVMDGDSFYEKETLENIILKKVMKRNPQIMREDHSLSEALNLMTTRYIGCLPIIDEYKRLVGVLDDQLIVKFIAGLV